MREFTQPHARRRKAVFLLPMITQSAQLAAVQTLATTGITVEKLVEAKLTPEQARDVISCATGVRISAGLLQWMMDLFRSNMAADARDRDWYGSSDDTRDNFMEDKLGRAIAKKSGRPQSRRTLMFKLISQQV